MNKQSRLAVLMALLAVVGVLTSAPSQTWADFCPGSHCFSASQCSSICPSASSVACVDGSCEYTFSPGGPGGGGQECPVQGRCLDDEHCDFGFVQGSCVSGFCVC